MKTFGIKIVGFIKRFLATEEILHRDSVKDTTKVDVGERVQDYDAWKKSQTLVL